MKALVVDSHMHTPLCKHAVGEPEAYAEAGIARNIKAIIVTCHSPMPNGFSRAVRMGVDQFSDYLAMVERARRAFEGRLEVRLGLESDWYPGMEDWLRELHQKAPFDYILGSVHPFTPEYMRRFDQGTAEETFRHYFNHLAEAAETGLFDSLSHPDIVKIMYPGEWSVDRMLPVIEVALDRIRETGVAMELNTSGVLKKFPEMNPGPVMLQKMAEREIPVVLGSDSHEPRRVGDGFEVAMSMLQEAGYSSICDFSSRKPNVLAISAALESLQ